MTFSGKSPGVYVIEVPSVVQPISGVGTSTAGFIGVAPSSVKVPQSNPAFNPTQAVSATNSQFTETTVTLIEAGKVRLCTNFGEFKDSFGNFSSDPGQSKLAHAVYGFFNNGGTRCYVVRVAAESEITDDFLSLTFEGIDEIAIVVAPGIIDDAVRSAITTHCQQRTQDRFAIFDSPEVVETANKLDLSKFNPGSGAANVQPNNTNYGAVYFPWIEVFDPATKIQNPQSTGRIFVPPSGHIAGIYARVDTMRGVFKAPANEPILGALGLKYQISKAQQDGLKAYPKT